MSWVKNITDPSEVVKKGDEVEAIVLAVQKEDGKISLGIKQTEHNPWDDVEKKYPVGSNVKAEIRSLTNYGAFVELEPGVEGLDPYFRPELDQKSLPSFRSAAKGDVVDAVVLSVDRESKKITLGVKQLGNNPWESIEKTMPVGTLVKGKVTKITAFGAFVELDNGIEGLDPRDRAFRSGFWQSGRCVPKGDEITAKVIKVDPEHKKIALSIKEYLIDKNQ